MELLGQNVELIFILSVIAVILFAVFLLAPRITEGQEIPTGVSFRKNINTLFQIIVRFSTPWTSKKKRWYDFEKDLFYINVIVKRNYIFRFRVRTFKFVNSWELTLWQKLCKCWISSHNSFYVVKKYEGIEPRELAEERLGVENIFETCGNRQWSRQ